MSMALKQLQLLTIKEPQAYENCWTSVGDAKLESSLVRQLLVGGGVLEVSDVLLEVKEWAGTLETERSRVS